MQKVEDGEEAERRRGTCQEKSCYMTAHSAVRLHRTVREHVVKSEIFVPAESRHEQT